MREILFRGKQKDNGKWIEGYLVNAKWYLDDLNTTMIVPKDAMLYPRSELSGWEEIIPETVGQFTGMLDKNGKKIFEGDIVRDYFGKVKTVSFMNGRYIPFNVYPEYMCWNENACKVIGNIHDNPELLEANQI